MRLCPFVAVVCALVSACSSNSKQPETKSTRLEQPLQAKGTSTNPAAKYLELVGFRLKEKGPGKIDVAFGVVNHSEADLGDLVINVSIRTTTAKPGEAPLFAFPAKVPSLGPEEMKEVTASVPTKLRIYELPDWQYLRAEFEITEPK